MDGGILDVVPVDRKPDAQAKVHGEDTPTRPPHPGFGFALLWCLAFVLAPAMLIVPIVFITKDENVLTVAGQLSMLACVLALIATVFGRKASSEIAWRAPEPLHLFLTIVSYPAVLTMVGLVYVGASMVLPGFDYEAKVEGMIGKLPLVPALMTFALCPAFGEELFCRGFLGRGLVGHYGWVNGILLTSLLFGLLHLDPPHFVAMIFLGCWLHAVYAAGRSLWLPICLHGLHNSLAVLIVHEWIAYSWFPRDKMGMTVAAALVAVILTATSVIFERTRVRVFHADGSECQPAFPGVAIPQGDVTRTRDHPPRWIVGMVACLSALLIAVCAFWR